ncbi:hypothetical protein Ancab_005870 [Ancistrocladus abbreviatus]
MSYRTNDLGPYRLERALLQLMDPIATALPSSPLPPPPTINSVSPIQLRKPLYCLLHFYSLPPPQMDAVRAQSCKPGSTSVHITALDGIVNVNSLFTLAVFIGLAWNPNDPSNTLVEDQTCAGTASIAESLVTFHVYSFSSFLFSSLVALGLKQAIRISRTYESYRAYVHKSGLRLGMLVSAVGSVCGCGFLMLALINVVQIKLGTLACGSSHSFAAVVPLVILVPLGLLIYVSFVLYAFTR